MHGLGVTVYSLSMYLYDAGAVLCVADIQEEVVERTVDKFRSKVVDPDCTHTAEPNVLAHCVMGAEV